MHLPVNLYSAAQCRELDRLATRDSEVDGYTLMNRAGAAACRVLRLRWPSPARVLVLCGTGNNGGDGFVIARLLAATGIAVRVLLLGDPTRIGGDAATALAAWRESGGAVEDAAHAAVGGDDPCVDALFGTGLTRAVEDQAAQLIERLNQSRCPVLSVDMPSGIDSDTGAVAGVAVRATMTITFIALKPGLFTGAGARHAGLVSYDDLRVSPSIIDSLSPVAVRVSERPQHPAFVPAPLDAHKNTFGHVLAVGGDQGMAGAIALCAAAALRTGAGLVSVATREAHAQGLTSRQPELMVHGVEDAAGLQPLVERAGVLVIGPGLGTGAWGRAMLAAALESNRPLVVDADALNLLAATGQACPQAILTPHPGEAARLLGITTAAVQQDRFGACRRLHETRGAVVLLKGRGSVVFDGAGMTVIDRGTPALATAGSGDVLSGVLAALRSRSDSPGGTAVAGGWLHAAVGESVAQQRDRGMLAGDLVAALGASAAL